MLVSAFPPPPPPPPPNICVYVNISTCVSTYLECILIEPYWLLSIFESVTILTNIVEYYGLKKWYKAFYNLWYHKCTIHTISPITLVDDYLSCLRQDVSECRLTSSMIILHPASSMIEAVLLLLLF